MANQFITKEESYTDMVGTINKKLKEYQKLRPSLDYYQVQAQGYGSYSGKGGPVGYIPYYKIGNQQMENLAFQSDIFMTVINALRNKIFRRGFKIESIVKDPNTQQLKHLNEVMRKINDNNQSTKDILKTFEQDQNIYDDAYLISVNNYIFNEDGDIADAKTQEIVRASPTVMAVVADSEGRLGYTYEGERVFVGMTNRERLYTEEEAKVKNMRDDDGLLLQPAYYRGVTYYGNEQRDVFYIPGEVLHLSKHNPTLINGRSPMFAIWMKMVTLIEQDRYLLLNYQKGRPPRGILAISTTNFASAQAAWESAKSEARKDPHSINPMLIGDKDGKGKIEWIELMKPLGDMQFIESRNEMRRGIGALYGVMPLFSGDLSESGGLNNEGLQIEVTNQAVEEGQKLYNEKVFPWILERMGVTDYRLELEEPEEKDEVIDAKIRGIKIDNAVRMSQMGFEVRYNKQDDEFIFSEEIKEKEPEEFMGDFEKDFITLGQTEDMNDLEREFNNVLGEQKERDSVLNIRQEKDLHRDAYDMIMSNEEEMRKEGLELIRKEDSLKEFIIQSIFDRKFEGLSVVKSNAIKSIIVRGILDKDSLTTVVDKIKKMGIDKEQAELIARTENAVLRNATREFNFTRVKGADDFLFKWIGPDDKRTSDISKEIKKKSAKGLKLETLKKLVRKTSESYGFNPDRDWFSHPNQRHSFIRVI